MPKKKKLVLGTQSMDPMASLTERFEFFCPSIEQDPNSEDDYNRLAFSVMTEKPLYQGGEKVEISVYVYEKWSKRPLKSNEQKIQLEKVRITVTDEQGLPIETLKSDLDRRVGVIQSSFILERGCKGGLYWVEVNYFDVVFDRTKFFVMEISEKRNAIVLDLNKDQLSVNEELQGKVTLKMFTRMEDFFKTGGLGEKIKFTATIHDQDYNALESITRELSHGKGFFNYRLPEAVNELSSLFVVVECDFEREKLETTREVIINKLNSMHVKFVAGGGKFVVECENRVFFAGYSSREMVDTMVFENAQIIEKIGTTEKVVVEGIDSNNDGRGEFSLNVKTDAEYHLEVEMGSTRRSFPIISEEDILEYPAGKFTDVQMRIRERVYSNQESINIHIKNNQYSEFDKFRLVLVDKLRMLHEAVVSFPPGFNKGNMKINLRTVGTLLNGGVLSLQLYDYMNTTEPLQECLVFVYPAKKLEFDIMFDKTKYSPGDTVNFEVDLGDRDGLVGVVVSDETPFLELERRDLPTSFCTKVYLEKELFFADQNFNESVKYIDWFFENNEFISQQLLEAGGVSPNYGLVGYKENKRKQLSILLGVQDWRLFFQNETSLRAFVKKQEWELTGDSLRHIMGLSPEEVSNFFYPSPKYLQMVCNDHGVRHGTFCSKRTSTFSF